VRFKVNRYLGWPGQSTVAKIGQRIWEQLLERETAARGCNFDIRGIPAAEPLDISGGRTGHPQDCPSRLILANDRVSGPFAALHPVFGLSRTVHGWFLTNSE
jgi:hypothetical protein